MASRRRIIVGITGMPGAGKSTVADALVELGFLRINMGDVIRDEALRRGVRMDDESLGKLMLQLRTEYGDDVIAGICLRKINDSSADRFVIDGLRSFVEAEAFRKAGFFKLLAVHASSSRRLRLLQKRGRADAPVSKSTFENRDAREKSIGIGRVIESADKAISNEDLTIDELRLNAVQIVKMWLKDYEAAGS
jgi:dephospho-CoA kinase